jgi:hypothetical protein
MESGSGRAPTPGKGSGVGALLGNRSITKIKRLGLLIFSDIPLRRLFIR